MTMDNDMGYWVQVENTATGHGGCLFLHICPEQSALVAKTVIDGIRNLRLAPDLKKTARITVRQVTELGRFKRENPVPGRYRIYPLPVAAFFNPAASAFKSSLFLAGVDNIVIQNGDFFPTGRLNAVATGSDFFGRQAECRAIVKQIGKGRNILLCGPRRYGKTSLMRRVLAAAQAKGLAAVMTDLEAIRTPAEFIAHLQTAVDQPGLSPMERNARIEELTASYSESWQEAGKAFFQKLADGPHDRVFILDEYPFMLDSFLGIAREEDRSKIADADRQTVSRFVTWFYEQRLACAPRCRFVLTGSVHPQAYLKDNHLDENGFADCRTQTLAPFDQDQTRLYIESLLLGRQILATQQVIDALVALLVPGIPYFIQIVMDHVVSLFLQAGTLTAADIEALYQDKVIGPDGRRSFDSFERHFKRYLERKAGARAILDALSGAGPEGLARDRLKNYYLAAGGASQDLDTVLQSLQYDFYVEKAPAGHYRFASPIFKDYWRRNQRQA